MAFNDVLKSLLVLIEVWFLFTRTDFFCFGCQKIFPCCSGLFSSFSDMELFNLVGKALDNSNPPINMIAQNKMDLAVVHIFSKIIFTMYPG